MQVDILAAKERGGGIRIGRANFPSSRCKKCFFNGVEHPIMTEVVSQLYSMQQRLL